MKPFLTVLLFLIISNSFAQENKRKIFVETGMKIMGGGEYYHFMGKTGFSFFQQKSEYEDSYGDNDGSNTVNGFSYSIAPRLGYFVGDKLCTGIDLQYFSKD